MAHDAHAGHATPDDEYLNPPSGSGHEHTDANVSLIVQYALWLAGAAIIVHIIMWFVFGAFVASREEASRPEYPLAVGQGQRLPAGPRLQAFPANEMYQFRMQENNILDNYAWIDRSAGTVRIPVAEAMRLTVERGLPARTVTPGDTQVDETPGMVPTDGSAGRTLERRRQ
jgi:hypothetical protein